MFMQAIKREHMYECVCMSVSSSTKSPVATCVCNGRDPGSAIRGAQRDACVCLCIRKIKGVCTCVSVIITLLLTATCVCVCMYCISMLTPLYNCDYIRQLFYC